MNKTNKAFRLVIKREMRSQGDLFEGEKYFHHAVATNWDDKEKSSIEVLKWHNQRGQAENFNKELKIGFGMERMLCGQTEANAVFFRIGVIAYNPKPDIETQKKEKPLKDKGFQVIYNITRKVKPKYPGG